MIKTNNRILIAGIGAGSLGIELLKCFALSGKFQVFGADIAEHAYGIGDGRFIKTKTLPNSKNSNYIRDLLMFAEETGASIIAPGAEATAKLLSEYRELFSDRGIELMINSRRVVDLCSDKIGCNNYLSNHGFKVAKTLVEFDKPNLASFDCYPCIIKPAENSGGSNMVFLAENMDEAVFFIRYLEDRGLKACVQEYIDSKDEFTVGVLSSRDGHVLTSVALKRDFGSKLSRAMSYGDRVISSGWSQGYIDYFPEVCQQAESIAKAVGSAWAINLQGRLKDGVFIPFEINPRHSGTSYLRALAGVNEPVLALNYLASGNTERPEIKLKTGKYLRVLNEYFVPNV